MKGKIFIIIKIDNNNADNDKGKTGEIRRRKTKCPGYSYREYSGRTGCRNAWHFFMVSM